MNMCYYTVSLLWMCIFSLLATCVSLSARKSDEFFNELLRRTHRRAKSYNDQPKSESLSNLDLQHIVERLHNNVNSRHRPLEAPVRYLLEVFGRLQAGQGLSEASGHPYKSPSISTADTVRSFNTRGRHAYNV